MPSKSFTYPQESETETFATRNRLPLFGGDFHFFVCCCSIVRNKPNFGSDFSACKTIIVDNVVIIIIIIITAVTVAIIISIIMGKWNSRRPIQSVIILLLN